MNAEKQTLDYAYDPSRDVFTIEGQEIHGDLLRLIAGGDPRWETTVYRLEKRPGFPTIAHAERMEMKRTG